MKFGGIQKTSLIDYPGHICSTIFTIGCNFRCLFCYNTHLIESTAVELSEEKVLDFLKKRAGLIDSVVITGGEPTLHSDLPDLCKKMKDLNLLVGVDTNGSNPEMLEKLFNEKLVDYIAMDIKGPIEKYDEITRAKVDKNSIQKSIDLIRSSGIDYEFRTTIVPGIFKDEDAEKIGKWLDGSNKYFLQQFMPTETIDENFKNVKPFTDEQLNSIKDKMERFFKKCEIRGI